MKRIAEKIEVIAHNPYLNVVMGLILLGTGLVEAGDTIFEDLSNMNVGAHHGVMLFGLAHAFKALPAMILGIELAHHHSAKE